MTVPAVAQRSFAGGEIAPALYARTDQTKYANGARTLRNMMVQVEGGLANRPGLVYTYETKNSAVQARLIEFVRDANDVADTYLLELGNGYIRFYQNGLLIRVAGVSAWVDATDYEAGDLVSVAGVNYYCRTAHNSTLGTDKPGVDASWQTVWYALEDDIYEIPTPYQTADLGSIVYSQEGDVIVLTHVGYAPRELRRYDHTDWTLVSIVFGPSIDPPTNILATGAGAAGTTYYAVTAIKSITLEESLVALYTFAKVVSAANPATLTWDPVAGAISYRVYRGVDSATFGLLSVSGGVPGEASDTSWADDHEVASGTDPMAGWVAAAGQLRNVLSVSATARAYDAIYTVHISVALDGNAGAVGASTGRFKVYYSRDSETRILGATSDLYIVDGEGTFAAGVDLAISVPDNGYTTLTIEVVPEVVAPLTAGTADFTVDATSTPYDRVTWQGNAAGFIDDGDAPDYSQGPPSKPALFDAPGKYPAAVTHYQQRRVFARTTNEPESAYASRIGSFSNFCRSTPLQDDDAVSFTLAGHRVNAIQHILDLGKLVMFGSSRELVVQGDDAGILRPDAINPGKLSANGSGSVAPIELDDSAIYLQGRGRIVRDLKPVGLDGYQGTNLTIFARHLFKQYSIVDWAYQLNPNSIIWAVRSDGILLGFTYNREQAVWAWHRHDTDGLVEAVRVIPEGDQDAVYVIVKRTINGATVRYVERMADRYVIDIEDFIFMDAAASYDGWAQVEDRTVTITGGTAWSATEQLTATVSSAFFNSGHVADGVFIEDEDGVLIRFTIEEFVSSTVVRVRSDKDVPASMQGVAIGNDTNGAWAFAVNAMEGLDHLEGEDVAILGDGFVVASPNNSDYPIVSVNAGVAELNAPYAVVHVGLPYISDLETLDIDHPGQATTKNKEHLVSAVGLYIESSRGIWAGQADNVDSDPDNPLDGLQELKARESEDYDDPTDLLTDFVQINIESNWNSNGRVFVRQVDPVPLLILSVTPIGDIAQ